MAASGARNQNGCTRSWVNIRVLQFLLAQMSKKRHTLTQGLHRLVVVLTPIGRNSFLTICFRDRLLDTGVSTALNHARWVAALAVCSAHQRNLLFVDFSEVSHPSLLDRVFYACTLFATQAVAVFFVISGFLIGGSLIRSFSSTNGFILAEYTIDRLARIYAPLVPAIALSLAFQHFELYSSCTSQDNANTIASNAILMQNLFSHPLCNNHPLWSLSSEAFYYVVAPCLIVGIKQRNTLALFWLAFCGNIVLICWDNSFTNIGFGLLIWLMGLIPWYVDLNFKPFIGLVLVAMSLLITRSHLVQTDFLADAITAATFSAFLCCRFRKQVPSYSSVVSRRLASFSYSLYLIHMPIGQAIAHLVGGTHSPKMEVYLIYFATVLSTLMCAWLFGLAFERHTGHLRFWLKRNTRSSINAPFGTTQRTA